MTQDEQKSYISHFNKNSARQHPLLQGPKLQHTTQTWVNPVYNNVWEPEEIVDALNTQPKHKAVEFGDKIMYGLVRTLYHTFNFITGYSRSNPSGRSLQYRLIILESVAGVPGMVA